MIKAILFYVAQNNKKEPRVFNTLGSFSTVFTVTYLVMK